MVYSCIAQYKFGLTAWFSKYALTMSKGIETQYLLNIQGDFMEAFIICLNLVRL
jgi:hypothetical protein